MFQNVFGMSGKTTEISWDGNPANRLTSREVNILQHHIRNVVGSLKAVSNIMECVFDTLRDISLDILRAPLISINIFLDHFGDVTQGLKSIKKQLVLI